ncbi:ATPase, activator of (R)-hydroxyglutaryl-CoA dehydratase [uncultured Desulfobacterium sp.]|uniref:ATPase, activator of (R)-hydroxyglutaryl-CoA dehydratase n=1 Tax=uncultured Desulfobacterium sp. TaxID=201089 RepID=A0A445N0U8_9BACT|nr:ATPase, activator of (R)-hydroxyglutaryl-CoA dehydratase [uncultured Desulfobacterium sp.]
MFAGIDVGSLTAKAVLIDEQGTRFSFITETGDNPKRAGETVFEEVIKKAGAKRNDVKYIIGTGYGRIALSFADHAITELTCHAKGAYFLNPAIRTLIDIGGQDSKVIRLNQNGGMADFVMNDKCAAGTGRFLEVMAGALKVDLREMGDFSLRSNNPCVINSICTVFAESEVISLLASGQAKEDIIAGLHQGIAKRVGNMARRLGIKDEITFVGGVSKNTGLKSGLENYLEIKFAPVGEDPQIVGALGAALLARERYYSERKTL